MSLGTLSSVARAESAAAASRRRRRPFKDDPRAILIGIALLIAALAAFLTLANRSPSFTPDFLSEFVLYALTAADLTMLVALAFVLARNIVKIVVEQRRALPFARFRGKLVALLLAMTVVPSMLVLIVGSELIRTSVERWFNAPMDDVLTSANQIASDYYHERQVLVRDHASRIAQRLGRVDLAAADSASLDTVLGPELSLPRVALIHVYRVTGSGPPPALEPVADLAATPPPPGASRAVADDLARHALAGGSETQALQSIGSAGDLLVAAAPVHNAAGRATGIVVVVDHVTGELAARSRRMTRAFENYSQLRVLKRPLTGVYLSFFLMVTLLVLVGATWMGLYLAKRITRPVQMLAAAAKEIGAGRLDQHVEPQSNDEFGSLVEAFNAMAAELAASRRRIERTNLELERKNVEVEARRRYIETVLERIATGVVSVDATGAITMVNSAAARLLSLDRPAAGQPASVVFARADLQPLGDLIAGAGRVRTEPPAQEIAVTQGGRELQLAAVATALVGESGAPEGVVLVIDDVTPLIRAQKVAAWREVARRLAHEIKNPLTPIQLCAERLQRNFSGAAATTKALVDECTATIVGEVESLKGLVDEFSQFARMPAPRTMPADLAQLVSETLSLYNGIFTDVTLERRFAPAPLVRIDPEQMRRVIINLVDNAIEAMERRGGIVLEVQHDPPDHVVRLTVADDGPGIPEAERDKLFLPYYSTKRRGSGLGLAIVRRIVAEHGGTIGVSDNSPRGTRFTIELPC